MPFDAIFMTALAGELRQALTGGKVDKLYQPARDEAGTICGTGLWAIRRDWKSTVILTGKNMCIFRKSFAMVTRRTVIFI